jgi:hypothetical protein
MTNNTTTNDTTTYSSSITADLLPYYALPNSDPSTCPSATEILLYLDLYLLFSCIASISLGSKPIRTLLSHNRLLSLEFASDHPHFLPWISIIGSLLIHGSATVVTAIILAASNASTTAKPPLGEMFLLWMSRPLATALITWLSIADREVYCDNAREVAIVDSLFGCVNIYLFGSVAYITNVKPSDVPTPARLARAGSAVWLLAFILSLLVLPYYTFLIGKVSSFSSRYGHRRVGGGGGEKGADSSQLLPWLWFGLDALRFLGCWLLWAGLLFSNETAFCPSHRALALITVLWLFVPFMDCLWRGFATYKAEDGAEAENLIDLQ